MKIRHVQFLSVNSQQRAALIKGFDDYLARMDSEHDNPYRKGCKNNLHEYWLYGMRMCYSLQKTALLDRVKRGEITDELLEQNNIEKVVSYQHKD